MPLTPFRQHSFRAAAAALAALAAGCASDGLPPAPTSVGKAPGPHYKIGAPYKIKGKTYVPKADPTYEKVGVASWYGDAFHGKPTANGERFDKNLLSAAHKTLPLPSLVEVKNLENGRRAVLRVNDRGPFSGDRIIDVSHAAASVLDFENAGLAKVRVRYLGPADLYAMAERPGAVRTAQVAMAATPASAPLPAPEAARSDAPDPMAALIETSLAAAPAGEFWIVVGEYGDLNALERARIGTGEGDARVLSAMDGERVIYELQVGPEYDPAAVDARLAALREAGYPDARIADSAF